MHEFGVRIAIGATPGNVMSLVLREAFTRVAIGASLGIAAARVDAKKLTVLRATAEEAAAHEKILDAIDKAAKEKGGSLWRRINPS